ncbi:hypothetical protein AHF37_12754 [Paragonimus kellicotti]|nr:hypothetical protein AHF37_12754 [Paragonimus kellicotti]
MAACSVGTGPPPKVVAQTCTPAACSSSSRGHVYSIPPRNVDVDANGGLNGTNGDCPPQLYTDFKNATCNSLATVSSISSPVRKSANYPAEFPTDNVKGFSPLNLKPEGTTLTNTLGNNLRLIGGSTLKTDVRNIPAEFPTDNVKGFSPLNLKPEGTTLTNTLGNNLRLIGGNTDVRNIPGTLLTDEVLYIINGLLAKRIFSVFKR